MDNALAHSHAMPASGGNTGDIGGRLAGFSARAKLSLAIGIVLLVGLVAALALWGKSGDYRVLYANLSDKDGGAILAQLSQMNVPYRHADGGSAILVPASQVHDVRLKLASAGLPKGSTVGFELMDNARFGQTQFQERLTFQRGLEGELVRSISGIAAVQAARVHLALPNQNGFFREQQKPSASVVLTLHPGRGLERAQIAGIVHLVASSVPELNTKSVSVLDQTGALLSGAAAEHSGGGLDANQLQYVAQIESNHVRRILDILEPVLGRDNLRAQVTADVDFTQSEATQEEWKPNQGANATAAVRSSQFSEASNGAGAAPSGVPGATSNQPPAPATAPVNGAAAPLHAAQNGTAGGGARRDGVTNYELDKTVRVTRAATGNVKRLAAAVVVNHKVSADAKGKTTSTPLTAEELTKLESLVKESIGFNVDRGDSVKVINAPFRVEKVEPVPELPLWQRPETTDLLRAFAVPASLALIALAVLFGLIRPALKATLPPPGAAKGRALDAVVDDATPLPGLPAPPAQAPRVQQQLEGARGVARNNPQAVANIVRTWVAGEA
jgi:flagellar M-ring protein FliF